MKIFSFWEENLSQFNKTLIAFTFAVRNAHRARSVCAAMAAVVQCLTFIVVPLVDQLGATWGPSGASLGLSWDPLAPRNHYYTSASSISKALDTEHAGHRARWTPAGSPYGLSRYTNRISAFFYI